MKELVKKLNEAAKAYYAGEEIMSNYEYDALYEQLLQMEKESGITLPDSPTRTVGATAVTELARVMHEYPAKSLDKTKEYDVFTKAFRKGKEQTGCNLTVLMWKLDGSTLQCTYENGKLVMAATRGNGEEGSDVTHNAPYIKGLPMSIPYKGKLVVRGEATMAYSEFNQINENLPAEDQYKNPRNLATATIQLLDSNEMREREIWFNAFSLVYMDEMPPTFYERLTLLYGWGFNMVDTELVEIEDLENQMKIWEQSVSDYDIPVDGLVVAFNDAAYAETLPGTEHNPHVLNGYAFKWQDETAETVLRKIEWSASRTGLLNPVAVFDPVELEGTTVSRASLHNVSYIMELNLMVGDRITVYKANKIIPQIAENLSKDLHTYKLPLDFIPDNTCPVCGGETEVIRSIKNGSATLARYCMNEKCPAKAVGKFVHFCERDCMDVTGLSESTIEKLVERGYVREYADIFKLDRFKDNITKMEGFGEKSFENLVMAAEKAKKTSFIPFIHSLGIPNIGKGQAKLLSKEYNGDVLAFFKDAQSHKGFQHIEGVGAVYEANIWDWADKYLQFLSDSNVGEVDRELENLLAVVELEVAKPKNAGSALAGMTFVITGDVNKFKNRAELQKFIEDNGGKATGSVTGKTSYLINNDVESASGKNKKAKELGVPIVSEEEFLKLLS